MKKTAIRYFIKRQNLLFLFSFIFLIFAFLMGSFAFAETMPEATKTGAQACTVKQGIIILVEFPDVKHGVERSYVEKRFFKELNSYVREMSYNKVCIGGDVTKKWYRMPYSISRYKISPRNLEVDKSRLWNLIDDVLNAVDNDVDFSKYSFTVFFLGAKREEYGMIGLCGYPGMLGWSQKETIKTKSGQIINGGIAIFSYQAHLGTLFHDIAHILGGVKEGKRMVPCLYDHDLQAKPGPLREVFNKSTINMGFWDPMSCHYYKWNAPPPGISSWTKMRLNWVDQSKIKVVKQSERAELLLGPLEDGSSEILVIKIPLTDTTYYLIENRQPIVYDSHLPGSGVLILYADDNIPECRHGKAPVKLINADPLVPHLEGAAFDIGRKDLFIDEKNGLKIQLVEKIGNSYKILISPYKK